MSARLRAKFSFANVISLLALFVALGGSAYAVAKISASDIKKDAVRSKHIKAGQVRSTDIKDADVGAIDLAPSSVSTGSVIDGGIGNADLGSDAVDSSRVGAGSLRLSDLTVATGNFDLSLNGGSLPANSCTQVNQAANPAPQAGDVSIPVLPAATADDGLSAQGVLQGGTGNVTAVLCNLTVGSKLFSDFGSFPVYVVRP